MTYACPSPTAAAMQENLLPPQLFRVQSTPAPAKMSGAKVSITSTITQPSVLRPQPSKPLTNIALNTNNVSIGKGTNFMSGKSRQLSTPPPLSQHSINTAASSAITTTVASAVANNLAPPLLVRNQSAPKRLERTEHQKQKKANYHAIASTKVTASAASAVATQDLNCKTPEKKPTREDIILALHQNRESEAVNMIERADLSELTRGDAEGVTVLFWAVDKDAHKAISSLKKRWVPFNQLHSTGRSAVDWASDRLVAATHRELPRQTMELLIAFGGVANLRAETAIKGHSHAALQKEKIKFTLAKKYVHNKPTTAGVVATIAQQKKIAAANNNPRAVIKAKWLQNAASTFLG